MAHTNVKVSVVCRNFPYHTWTRIGFWKSTMSQIMLVAPPPNFRFSLSAEKIHTLSIECENSLLLSNSELKHSTAGTSRKTQFPPEGVWIWRHLQTFFQTCWNPACTSDSIVVGSCPACADFLEMVDKHISMSNVICVCNVGWAPDSVTLCPTEIILTVSARLLS